MRILPTSIFEMIVIIILKESFWVASKPFHRSMININKINRQSKKRMKFLIESFKWNWLTFNSSWFIDFLYFLRRTHQRISRCQLEHGSHLKRSKDYFKSTTDDHSHYSHLLGLEWWKYVYGITPKISTHFECSETLNNQISWTFGANGYFAFISSYFYIIMCIHFDLLFI